MIEVSTEQIIETLDRLIEMGHGGERIANDLAGELLARDGHEPA
jgi:hypothetical protein